MKISVEPRENFPAGHWNKLHCGTHGEGTRKTAPPHFNMARTAIGALL
jgi:hypothetical protein